MATSALDAAAGLTARRRRWAMMAINLGEDLKERWICS